MTKDFSRGIGAITKAVDTRERRFQRNLTIERWLTRGLLLVGVAAIGIAICANVGHAEGNHAGTERDNAAGIQGSSNYRGDLGRWVGLNNVYKGTFDPANNDICGNECDGRTFKGPYGPGSVGLLRTVFGWFRTFDQASTTGGAPGYGGWSW